jgi:hypothetical protein
VVGFKRDEVALLARLDYFVSQLDTDSEVVGKGQSCRVTSYDSCNDA